MPPGLRERKKARTRATIQREALKLFSRNGYAATSVEQIAAAAEVSPSTFFRYFPTKDDVVLSDFMDHEAIQRFVTAPAELDVPAALAWAIEHSIGQLDEEDVALERTRNELIRTVPELRRGMLVELVRPMRLLADGIAARLRRPVDEDVEMYAGALIGGMMLMMPEITGEQPTPGRDEVVSAAVGRLQRLARILSLPPPTPGAPPPR
jgi:AcrR family transcriptional regulator